MKSFLVEKIHSVRSDTFSREWLEAKFDIPDIGIVAFTGPMRVIMADQGAGPDVKDLQTKEMLHFVIKQKRMSKRDLVMHQYFFLSLIAKQLGPDFIRERTTVVSNGLPITLSTVRYYRDMSMIHAGLFVKPERFNRPCLNLELLNIPTKDIALDLLFEYSNTIKEVEEMSKLVTLAPK